jgi:uncharacterized sodium:solute symporter family permease YidK
LVHTQIKIILFKITNKYISKLLSKVSNIIRVMLYATRNDSLHYDVHLAYIVVELAFSINLFFLFFCVINARLFRRKMFFAVKYFTAVLTRFQTRILVKVVGIRHKWPDSSKTY